MKHIASLKQISALGGLLGAVVLLFGAPYAIADTAYNSGSYGSCAYNECGIAIASSGTVSLNVVPRSTPTCTVQKDTISVTTDSSTGYSLMINDSDTSNSMTRSTGPYSVPPTTGTYTSPVALANLTWGYRVDGTGNFGAGTTTAQTNGNIPSGTYAAVPKSTDPVDTIVNSGSPANPAVNTSIWFGMCTNTSLPSGTYNASVIYTALVN